MVTGIHNSQRQFSAVAIFHISTWNYLVISNGCLNENKFHASFVEGIS